MVIVHAKLEEPIMSEDIIIRKKILEVIKDKKNIYITAPGGYGKTVLLQQLAKEAIVIWYQLDEEDNFLINFFTYIIEGIERKIPRFKSQFLESFYSQKKPQQEVVGLNENKLCDELIGAIQRIDKDIVIKLDDYHWIKDQQIHKFIIRLLMYTPPNMQVIIASRSMATIRWDRLRNNFPILITEELLAFHPEEERQYLETFGKLNKHQMEHLQELREKNNGWPMGLKILKHLDKDMVNQKIDVLFRGLVKILEGEYRECIIIGAYLEYITPQLCNYVLQINSSNQMLSSLVEEGYFITKSKNNYRFHPLFREYIRGEYSLPRKMGSDIIDFFIGKNEIMKGMDIAINLGQYEWANNILINNHYRCISDCTFFEVLKWDESISKEISDNYYALKILKLKATIIKQELLSATDIEALKKVIDNKEDKYARFYLKVIEMYKAIEEGEVVGQIYVLEELSREVQEYSIENTVDFIKVAIEILPYIWEEGETLGKYITAIFEKMELTHIRKNEIIFLAYIEQLLEQLGETKQNKEVRKILAENEGEGYEYPQLLMHYIMKGRFRKGKTLANKGISYYQKYKLVKPLPYLEFIIFLCSFYQGEYSTALRIYEKNDFWEREQNISKKFEMMGYYIRTLAYVGQIELAIEKLERYRRVSEVEKFGWQYKIEMILAEIHFLNKEYEKVYHHSQKVFELTQNIHHHKSELTRIKMIYGTSLVIEKKFEEVNDLIKAIDKNNIQFIQTETEMCRLLYKPLIEFLKKEYQEEPSYEIDTALTQTERKIKVKFFGDNLVSQGEKYVKWRTLKARDIFYYMAYHKREGVSKDKLLSILWEEVGRDKATNLLRTNIAYIRKSLKDIGIEENVIVYQNLRYRLREKYIKDDIEEFDTLVSKAAEGIMSNRIIAVEKLYHLCSQDFCKDINIEELLYINEGIKKEVRRLTVKLIQDLMKEDKRKNITIAMKKIIREFL